MALNVDIALNGGAVAGQATPGTVTVTNLGANAITLNTLQVTEPSGCGGISQPAFLALVIPGATGAGQPTINAGTQASYPFSIAPSSPAWAQANIDPTGLNPPYRNNAEATAPLQFTCNAIGFDATAVASVAGQGTLSVGVKAAFRPNSPSLGGALQFNGSANAVNSL